MVRVCLTLVVALIPLAGYAAHWQVADLGRLYKPHHCLDAAVQSFQRLHTEVQIDGLRASSWVAYADGIDGRHDAVITCTFGDNRGTRATLVLHSQSHAIHAHMLASRITHLFEDRADTITEAWKRSYD